MSKILVRDIFNKLKREVAKCPSNGPDERRLGSKMRPSFNDLADQLMSESQWAAARSLLEEAIREMPRDWKPVRDDPVTVRSRTCACWDMEEFLAYVGAKRAEGYLDKWIAES